MQVNLDGKVQLVIVDIPKNLHVPMVSTKPSNIPPWNRKVDEYIVAIFDFVQKFLASSNFVLLFHLDDLKVMKEVSSYLESLASKFG